MYNISMSSQPNNSSSTNSKNEFSVEEVSKIADLAYLKLTPKEIEAMTSDLNVINDAINKVREVATDDVEGSSHPIELTSVMREDTVATFDDDLLSTEDAVSGGPKVIDNQFVTPQILGED